MVYDRDKDHLFPLFAEMLHPFEVNMSVSTLPFYLFEGLRTFDKQFEYWRQGRITPGKIVTWALPGLSWHQYGMAVDYVLDGMLDHPGIQWSWDIKADLNADGRNDWLQMAEIAKACGLEAGFFWPEKKCDAPHIQHSFGMTVQEAKALYETGGMTAVWNRAEEWYNNQIWP